MLKAALSLSLLTSAAYAQPYYGWAYGFGCGAYTCQGNGNPMAAPVLSEVIGGHYPPRIGGSATLTLYTDAVGADPCSNSPPITPWAVLYIAGAPGQVPISPPFAGVSGCYWWLSGDTVTTNAFPLSSPVWFWYAIPNNSNLIGTHVYHQALSQFADNGSHTNNVWLWSNGYVLVIQP